LQVPLRSLGAELGEAASRFASCRGINLQHVEDAAPGGSLARLKIVLVATRWCRFWGERGHTLEACIC
jgi:hypothetical protein